MRPDIAINILKLDMNVAQEEADEFRATANLDNYTERFALFDLERRATALKLAVTLLNDYDASVDIKV